MVKDDIFDYFGFSGLSDAQLDSMGYITWMSVQEMGSWISEGDTPTFMNLLDNGLRGYEDATFGGWGGRQGDDVGPDGPDPQYASARFFGAAQRDLAARLKWSVTRSIDDANHEPVVRVEGPLNFNVKAGEAIRLSDSVSDPDGDSVSVRWWQYVEAGHYPNRVMVSDSPSLTTNIQVPGDAAPGNTIHLVLEATDNGAPALTRYRRLILSVIP